MLTEPHGQLERWSGSSGGEGRLWLYAGRRGGPVAGRDHAACVARAR